MFKIILLKNKKTKTHILTQKHSEPLSISSKPVIFQGLQSEKENVLQQP